MARKKKLVSSEQISVNNSGATLIRATCNDCGEIGRLIFFKSPIESGGTRCKGCGKFDNFRADYEQEGNKYAFISVKSNEGISVKLVVLSNDAEKLQDFFKLQSLEHWEYNNILIEAGLLKGQKSNSRFVYDIDQQAKHERFIAAKLKAFIK